MGTALRARQVTPVTAVAFGVFLLGVGISRVPLESLIHQTELGGSAAEWLTSAAALVSVAAVGAFLAARRPRNRIGWIVLAIFLLAAAPWWLRRCSIRCVAGVQRAVDRRFNRAHYNAETVVAAFTMRLRQTVDLTLCALIWSMRSSRRSSPPTLQCLARGRKEHSACPGSCRRTPTGRIVRILRPLGTQMRPV